MESVPRFIKNYFKETGFEICDWKEFLSDGRVEVHLRKQANKEWRCYRCGDELKAHRGKYRVRVEGLPIMSHQLWIFLWREKGECRRCKKVRSEAVAFISKETPHLTQDYSQWLGKLCEISPVSRVAEFVGQDENTLWRLDLSWMRRMLAHYKIPKVRRISVDEVYARKKPRTPEESRNQRFFTVITDLDTRKVIWVSEGRDEASLDQFFILIGQAACRKISVVATDQHADYARSVAKYCKNATLVWDRFHIVQNFEKAVNEERKDLHEAARKSSNLKDLSAGKYRFIFLKKAKRRTESEQKHLKNVIEANDQFLKLELVKERMITFFDQPDAFSAREVFMEVGAWIHEAGFEHLNKWWWKLEHEWDQLVTYFTYRVTTAVSEGINNVIKALKRRAFGFRNMEYFRLKVMQCCGYLNSKFIGQLNQWHALI